MSALSDILVVAETADGELSSQTREVLGLARRLADGSGGAVGAVLLGEAVGIFADGGYVGHV